MNLIAQRVAALGHTLPKLGAPSANFVHHTQAGRLLYLSGKIGEVGVTANGPVGAGVSVEEGRRQAEIAALGLLAALDAAIGGDDSRIVRVLRLGVFVASAPDFRAHSEVANGASDLFTEVLGERGRHARTAIGVASLPAGCAVEVDAIVEVLEG